MNYEEIPTLQRLAPAPIAARIEDIYQEIRRALQGRLEWEAAVRIIDEWVTRHETAQQSPTYEALLEVFLQCVIDGHWPKIGPEFCPVCHGAACFECDGHGTRAGWQLMQQMHAEAMEAWDEAEREQAAYIKAGVCSGCGAKSRAEAASLCKPHAVGETGEYSCAGEGLWEGE